MIKLEKIRDLDVEANSPRPVHLSAASGLVCHEAAMYVITDDDLHLGVFPVRSSGPGGLIRLFDGVLPQSHDERKKQKPDLEALTLIPPYSDLCFGALLAIGSGSRSNRKRSVLLGLDACGTVCTAPRIVDLSFILDPLAAEFAQVNIEGAVVAGQELRLFQRGNKRHIDNAVIRYSLSAVLDGLDSERANSMTPIAIERFNLGTIRGTPFGFTDAAALSNGDMVFSAVAEDTEDAFHDGPCVGAGIGIIDDRGRLLSFDRIEGTHKVEGIHARLQGEVLELLLVTDADSREVPATLFSACISR
ncbi:hypothetical protein GOC76_30105 [Sinorhizobium medicae]|nr:hypothetical protein [Sinorhizobium medicae]